ncbi:MAG: 50S ribosomal protein L13 [Bacteroidia bacterium]
MNTLSYKTLSANSSTIEKQWFVIDVEGKVLGRAASEIAKLLRGKHKPSFTPHTDCGDNVIVINADKVRLTGNKADKKEYLRHTGYPGGQRVTTFKELISKQPEKVIEKAVKGMLPKNKLASRVLGNLRVYAGSEHPHEAQNPEVYEI